MFLPMGTKRVLGDAGSDFITWSFKFILKFIYKLSHRDFHEASTKPGVTETASPCDFDFAETTSSTFKHPMKGSK